MANYGRGWDDGYGSQSGEAMDAYHDRDRAQAERARLRPVRQRADFKPVARRVLDALETDGPNAVDGCIKYLREQLGAVK